MAQAHQQQLTYDGKWLTEPAAAFADFLASPEYAEGNRSSSPLPPDHRLTARSARVYVAMFGKFMRYLQARRCAVPEADAEVLRGFFTGELADASRETVARYLRLLERLYAHLNVKPNPAGAISRATLVAARSTRPATPTPRTQPTPAQMARLLRSLAALAEQAYAAADCLLLRNTAMMAAALGAGLRNTELASCRLADVRWRPAAAIDERIVFVIHRRATTKLAKFHEAPTHPQALAALALWLQARHQARDREESPFRLHGSALVFPSMHNGLAIGGSAVVDALDQVRAQLGEAWPDNIELRGARSLRTLFALRHLIDGGDHASLQTRMGLQQLRSARKYVAPRTGTRRT